MIVDLRGAFQTAPAIRFVGADFPYAAAAVPSFVLDGAVRCPLDQLWENAPLRGLDLVIDGRNLTDQRYKEPSGRPAVNPTGTPQPPRQVMVGLALAI